MSIETLVRYQPSTAKIFEQLTQAWIAEGFSLRGLDKKTGEISCSGRISARAGMDVSCACHVFDDGTIVQVICAPNLIKTGGIEEHDSPAEGQRILDEIMNKLENVLNRVGSWEEVSYQALEARGISPHALTADQTRSKRRPGLGMVWAGLAVAVLGSLMAYLDLQGIVSIGSYQAWLMVSVSGVFLLCVGIFRLVWHR